MLKRYTGKVFLTSPNSHRANNTNSKTNKITNSNSNKNNTICNNNYNNNYLTDTCNLFNTNSTRYKVNKKTLIKTLSDENLEKYVVYQLKKYKPNFNRINMSRIGIKILCSDFI